MSTQPSPTAGMNIAQRILHVGGRNNAAGYVEFGSTQAVEALVRQVLRDLPAQPRAVPTKQQLTDMLAQLLSGTYHCTRVWAAWGVGAMSEDDFEDVGESDTPAELADAVLAEFEAAGYSEAPTQQAQGVPEGWKPAPLEPTLTMRAAGKMEQNRYTGMDPLLPLAVYRAMLAAAPALPAPTPAPEICGNCDTPAPGCGGLFASDGKVCKFHGVEGTKP